MERFGTVIFDCDSTLSTIEGIEELASSHRAEVSALTEAAMQGEVALEDVYGRRLSLVSPRRDDLRRLGDLYLRTLVADAREVIEVLRSERVDVRVLSGGLRPAVVVLTRALGIADDAVAAVDVFFDDTGAFAGYDIESPLGRAHGKAEVIDRWRDAMPKPVMLVGDGATDQAAMSRVDLFVAFAGVVDRPTVTAPAEVVLRQPSLAPIVPLALGGRPPADARFLPVYQRGLRLLGSR